MDRTKVQVPREVLNGLEVVRISGRTNMLDIFMVIQIALENGAVEVAWWVMENRVDYIKGVLNGFEVDGGEQECADR